MKQDTADLFLSPPPHPNAKAQDAKFPPGHLAQFFLRRYGRLPSENLNKSLLSPRDPCTGGGLRGRPAPSRSPKSGNISLARFGKETQLPLSSYNIDWHCTAWHL